MDRATVEGRIRMRSSSLSLSLSSSSCTHAREENLRHTRCDDNRRMRFKRNGNFAYDGVNVIEGIEILLLLVRVRRRARVKSLRRPERGREEKKKKENIPIRGKRTGRLNRDIVRADWKVGGGRKKRIVGCTCAACFDDSPSAC